MTEDEKQIECFISVAVAVENCGGGIEDFIESLTALLRSRYTNYEILLVDNRSTDNTAAKIERLLSRIPNLRLIQLSQKYDIDTVYTAGVQTAIGDFVVLMQPGHDPIAELADMVRMSRGGSDIVMGVSSRNPAAGYRMMRWLFRVLFSRIVDYSVPSNYTGYTVISRRAVNALMNYNCRNRSLFVRMTQIGFTYSSYIYQSSFNSPVMRRNIFNGIEAATKLLVFNSFAPLRIISMAGFLGSICSLLACVYTVAIRLFKNNVIEGWTTMMLLVSGLFTIMFIIMAFQSEYLARLLEEQYQRSEYFVVSEKHSSVMVDTSRLNVFEKSVSSDTNAVQTGRDK